jgi:hypothetical protein
MKQHFSITYNQEIIQVESDGTDTYNLKYRDFKYLMLDRDSGGWVVEDRSGDYWSDEDIKGIGALIEKNQPRRAEDEDIS